MHAYSYDAAERTGPSGMLQKCGMMHCGNAAIDQKGVYLLPSACCCVTQTFPLGLRAKNYLILFGHDNQKNTFKKCNQNNGGNLVSESFFP